MEKTRFTDLYFDWLTDRVCTEKQKDQYSKLLHTLHSVEFFYILEADANRAADGIDLRQDFADEHGMGIEERRRRIYGPCTVLEMLVALALRCDFAVLDGEMGDVEDEAREVFWIMMENLGFTRLKNAHFSRSEVVEALDVLMRREYGARGQNGGLFEVQNPRQDMRNVEIWYQMCWYFSEKLDF